MDWGVIILDLILTVFFYLFVPVVFCIRNKPMTEKQIKKVIIINAISVWILIVVIISASGGEPQASGAVFLWSWVGKKIMERVLLREENDNVVVKEKKETKEVPKQSMHEGVTHICYSDPNDISEKKSGLTYGNDIALQQNTTSSVKISYCRKCGNKLIEDSQFCNKCGTKVISEE